MNLAPALLKRIERTLSDVAGFAGDLDGKTMSEETWHQLQASARDAQDILMRLPRKAPKKALPEPLRKQVKAERRAIHRQQTKALREERMKIDGGRCSECKQPDSAFNPLHLHHDKGGNGRRRQQQSISNTRMLCMLCHHKHHAGKK